MYQSKCQGWYLHMGRLVVVIWVMLNVRVRVRVDVRVGVRFMPSVITCNQE